MSADSAGTTSLLAAGIALAAALALPPVAIRAAGRAGLLDRPSGWKSHAGPTPYLGGVAVLAATAAGAGAVGWLDLPWELAGATAALAVVGLVDDARRLKAWPRVAAELGAAVLVWSAGLGWTVGPEAVELALTAAWVLAVVNALNLIDLMDGVAASVAAAAAVCVAVLAGLEGQVGLAAAAAAGAGACAGFLAYNLARPSRIFLGDGGTMPIGLLLAVAVTSALEGDAAPRALAGAALFVAVPLADMAMRIAARRRRGDSVMMPGPDSVANALSERLGGPAATCCVLAAAQLALGAAAMALVRV